MDVSIYFIVFTLVFLMNLMVPKIKKTWVRRGLLILSFLTLVCFIGFRYNVGTDYDGYLKIYRGIKGNSLGYALEQNIDPANGILFWSLSEIFSVDYWIFFMYGVASILPIYLVNRRFGYKYLSYSLLAYCFIFLPFSLNGMMQGAAMSMVLLSSFYLLDKKYFKLATLLLLAILFHKSALLVLPHFALFYIFRKKNKGYPKINMIFTILISVFILYFLNNFLMNNSPDFYSNYAYIVRKISVERISLSTTIYYLPLVIFSILSKGKGKNDQISFQRNLLYTGIVYNLIGSSAQYLNRIALYFTIFSIIVVPIQIMKVENPKKKMILKILFIIYLISAFIVQVVSLGWHDLLPYQTWIFGGGV
ncbi:MAG: EpsG family protein [Candidatus Saccharibacteria bacterium]|nr:EpsG family protein [Candidatus Saccharibacteria bacterium]